MSGGGHSEFNFLNPLSLLISFKWHQDNACDRIYNLAEKWDNNTIPCLPQKKRENQGRINHCSIHPLDMFHKKVDISIYSELIGI
jgi:hypothetical protein